RFKRHNVKLAILAKDTDPRFRPNDGLLLLMKGNSAVDRPLVPLRNALVARDVPTWACCCDGYLSVEGLTARQAAALRAIRRLMPWMNMSWHIGGPHAQAITALGWYDHSRVNNAALADPLFIVAAEKIACIKLPAAGEL